jgi:hypothetical protein
MLATPRRLRLDSSCMLAVETKPSPVGSRRAAPLPLENGEFLHSREFLRLPVAPLLAGDNAKVLAALAEHEPPQASVKSQN